jgi:hypothetical protein
MTEKWQDVQLPPAHREEPTLRELPVVEEFVAAAPTLAALAPTASPPQAELTPAQVLAQVLLDEAHDDALAERRLREGWAAELELRRSWHRRAFLEGLRRPQVHALVAEGKLSATEVEEWREIQQLRLLRRLGT